MRCRIVKYVRPRERFAAVTAGKSDSGRVITWSANQNPIRSEPPCSTLHISPYPDTQLAIRLQLSSIIIGGVMAAEGLLTTMRAA